MCLDHLAASGGKQISLLQEVSQWTGEQNIEGYQLITQLDRPSAPAIPSDIAINMRGHIVSEVSAAALIGDIGVVSAYLADPGKPLTCDARSLRALKEDLEKLIQMGAKYFVIGMDAQTTLPENLDNLIGPRAMGDEVGVEGEDHVGDRQDMFLELMKKFGWRAATTWFSSKAAFIRTGWRENSRPVQIYYILTSRSITSRSIYWNSQRLMRSDHYPIGTIFTGSNANIQVRALRRSFTGWKPADTHRDMMNFRRGLMNRLGHSGHHDDLHVLPTTYRRIHRCCCRICKYS